MDSINVAFYKDSVMVNRHSEFPRVITVCEDVQKLAESIVDLLEDRLVARLSASDPKPLGLATGRTMEPVYRSLVARLKSWPVVDLQRLVEGWCSFNLDEYIGLSSEDDRSFSYYMTRHLGEPLQINPQKIWLPDGLADNPEHEAFSYMSHLHSFGGVGIQLLGLGVNGHIGFNEPPCLSDSPCRVVSLSESTCRANGFFFEEETQKAPSHAITLGVSEILDAEEIHLVVTGRAKASILYELLHSSCSASLPASWLRLHPNVFLWSDRFAFKHSERSEP